MDTLRRLLERPGTAAVLWHWTAISLLLFVAADARAGDQEGRQLEAQVKAAYLYKFAGYIEWPPNAFADAAAPFIIGVVGAADIADELNKQKSGRLLSDHPVEVRILKPADAGRGIHMIFIASPDAAQLRRAIDQYGSTPTLTISDVPGAMDAGCIINFLVVSNRIRFEISVSNAERRGLKVSSRLLAVAQRVETGRP